MKERIYDTGGTDWTDVPPRRRNETDAAYAARLRDYAIETILAVSVDYGNCEEVEEVEHSGLADVIVEVGACVYFLSCVVGPDFKAEEMDEEEKREFDEQVARENRAHQWQDYFDNEEKNV